LGQQVNFFQANTGLFTATSMRTSKVTEQLGKRSLIPDRSTPTLGPIQLSFLQNVLGILSQDIYIYIYIEREREREGERDREREREREGTLDECITHARLMMGLKM
jgi:hypothetical protein